MPFNFLALPPEIRNLVYSLAFVRSEPLFLTPPGVVRLYKDSYISTIAANLHDYINIILTCHQTHEESSNVLYSRNTFLFQTEIASKDGFPWIYRFMKIIGQKNCQSLKLVELFLDPYMFPTSLRIFEAYWRVTLATLWACCRLRNLTVTFHAPENGLRNSFSFTYVFDDGNDQSSTISEEESRRVRVPNKTFAGDWRGFEQLRLEMSAAFKAVESNQTMLYPNASFGRPLD
ncbi:MAG: hypothetical protein Q9186_005518 [Xanthomendoza sp. 1 TL-2023]